MTTTQEQAREILSLYFGLQRVAFGQPKYCVWPEHRSVELIRIVGYGCHNLPEIVAGCWCGWEPVGEEVLEEALRSQLMYLYQRLETLEYPSEWSSENSHPGSVWRTFCSEIAKALRQESRYGHPYIPAPESRAELAARALNMLHEKGWACESFPWWARLFRKPGYIVTPPRGGNSET